MTTPALPLGAGQALAAELLLREQLVLGLPALAADDRRLAELFERFDELNQGSHAATATEYAARLREIVLGSPRAEVRVGYPRGEMDLPCLSIVEQSGNEIDQTANFADRLSTRYEQVGTPTATDWSSATTYAHDTRGTQWTVAMQVSTWATTPEDSLILAAAAKAVIFDSKRRMAEAGVEEISLSEGGVEPGQDLAPLVGYVPVLTVRMDYTRRQTRRRQVPTRVKLALTFG